MLLLVDQQARAESSRFRARLRGLLLAKIRADIVEAGAGTRIPEFRQSTKQRLKYVRIYKTLSENLVNQ
jgi:hypothetical protein